MMIFLLKLHRFCTIYGCHQTHHCFTTKQISLNVQFYHCLTKFRGRNPVTGHVNSRYSVETSVWVVVYTSLRIDNRLFWRRNFAEISLMWMQILIFSVAIGEIAHWSRKLARCFVWKLLLCVIYRCTTIHFYCRRILANVIPLLTEIFSRRCKWKNTEDIKYFIKYREPIYFIK